ncbi:MAG: hypothetical protein HY093_02510 [Candidatus Liptonbacteria bacterium]|nr:hypothetical protein [Candidatus Liptonbacteria bacterium]
MRWYRIRARRTFEVAQTAGVCWGVDRAIRGIRGAARGKERSRVPQVLGWLIHDQNSIRQLEKDGIRTIESPEEATTEVIAITAHGRDPKDIRRLQEQGFKVLDMTCPIVTNQHAEALKLKESGRKIILVGTREPHPEVLGTRGVLDDEAIVVDSPFGAQLITLHPETPIGVIAQTTHDPVVVDEVLWELKRRFRDVLYVPTACGDIALKLEEIREKAQKADTIIVISEERSANGNNLARVARAMQKTVIFILDETKLERAMIAQARRIFITAAASKFERDIDGVAAKLKSWGWRRRQPRGPVMTKEERAKMSARQAAGH